MDIGHQGLVRLTHQAVLRQQDQTHQLDALHRHDATAESGMALVGVKTCCEAAAPRHGRHIQGAHTMHQ
jgi:hypothetical protein